VLPDTPRSEYIIGFGYNADGAAGGVIAARRHADARARGIKRVQFEPHLSVSGASATEWLAIKTKTDSAVLYAMLHVLLHEHTLTGLTEGAALLLLLLAAVQEAMPWLDYLLLGLLVARAVAAASYLHALARAKAPEATISVLKRTATPFLMVGSLIPLILIIIEISITTEANIAIIIAGILALVSGWYVKFTTVTRAAHVQGFSLGVPGPAS
jgi:hypothetical protein